MGSAPVQALFPKVRITPVDDPDADDPLFSRSDSVRVTLSDGTVLAGKPVTHARGHAHNPLGMDELRLKFNDCVAGALPESRRDALFERLAAAEKLTSVASLYS